MSRQIKFRYVGPGFIPGIPTRHLTADDVTRLQAREGEKVDIEAQLLGSGAYELEPVAPKKKRPKKDTEDTAVVPATDEFSLSKE